MITSLDTLAVYGSELTTEQLDDVDGGIIVLIAIGVLAFADGVLWGYIATH